jgi:NADH-ubiquinone oxidoreductase chain 4
MVVAFSLGSFLGTVFTIFIFSYTQHGKNYFSTVRSFNSIFSEYIVLVIHLTPLNFVVLVSEFFFLG